MGDPAGRIGWHGGESPVPALDAPLYRGGYRVATLAFALAGTALFWAVVQVGVPGRDSIELGALGSFVLARAAISWFPMDAPGTPRTLVGRWHGLLAVAALVSIAVAAGNLGHRVAPAVLGGFADTAHLLGPGLGAVPALHADAGPVVRRGASELWSSRARLLSPGYRRERPDGPHPPVGQSLRLPSAPAASPGPGSFPRGGMRLTWVMRGGVRRAATAGHAGGAVKAVDIPRISEDGRRREAGDRTTCRGERLQVPAAGDRSGKRNRGAKTDETNGCALRRVWYTCVYT